MELGSNEHKAAFIDEMRKDYIENIWKNELHLTRLNMELDVVKEELEKLNKMLAEKGKPAANEEKKQLFVLERSIEAKLADIKRVEAAKLQNEYGLHVLLPKYLETNG